MLICFKHPRYTGLSSPTLSCRVCCHLFIAEVKRRRDSGEPLPPLLDSPRAQKQEVLARSLRRFDQLKQR